MLNKHHFNSIESLNDNVEMIHANTRNANLTDQIGTNEDRTHSVPNTTEVNMTAMNKVVHDNAPNEVSRRLPRGEPFVCGNIKGFKLEYSNLDNDVPDADLVALSQFDEMCRDKLRGMTFDDFVNAVEEQDIFDCETGEIVELMYRREFYDEHGRTMTARKYAFPYAFCTEEQIITENGKQSLVHVCWTTAKNLRFAIDGELFLPCSIADKEDDSVSAIHDDDWWKVCTPEVHSCEGRDSFVKFSVIPLGKKPF